MEEVSAWAASVVGKSIDLDGAYGAQCVDLADAWAKELGKSLPAVTGAIDFAGATIPGFKWVANAPDNAPPPGALVVWGKAVGEYGHVAVCISAGINNFQSIDQNWVNSNPNGSPAAYVTHTYTGVLGWQIPAEAIPVEEVVLKTPVTGRVFQDSPWYDYGTLQPVPGQTCTAGTMVSVDSAKVSEGTIYDRIGGGAWCLKDADVDLGGKTPFQIAQEENAPPAPAPAPAPTPEPVPAPAPAPEPPVNPTPAPEPSTLSERDILANALDAAASAFSSAARSIRGTAQ